MSPSVPCPLKHCPVPLENWSVLQITTSLPTFRVLLLYLLPTCHPSLLAYIYLLHSYRGGAGSIIRNRQTRERGCGYEMANHDDGESFNLEEDVVFMMCSASVGLDLLISMSSYALATTVSDLLNNTRKKSVLIYGST